MVQPAVLHGEPTTRDGSRCRSELQQPAASLMSSTFSGIPAAHCVTIGSHRHDRRLLLSVRGHGAASTAARMAVAGTAVGCARRRRRGEHHQRQSLNGQSARVRALCGPGFVRRLRRRVDMGASMPTPSDYVSIRHRKAQLYVNEYPYLEHAARTNYLPSTAYIVRHKHRSGLPN